MKTIFIVLFLFAMSFIQAQSSTETEETVTFETEEVCCTRSAWPKEACIDGTLNESQQGERYKKLLANPMWLSYEGTEEFRRTLTMHENGAFLDFIKAHPANFKSGVNMIEMNCYARLKTHMLLTYNVCSVYLESDIHIFVTEAYRPITNKNEKGKTRPNCSPHVLGYAIDIRPGSTDGLATTWKKKNYDRKKTQEIVDKVHFIDPCAKMLFNDSQIKGVRPYDDHDDHIHITWSLNDMTTAVIREWVGWNSCK